MDFPDFFCPSELQGFEVVKRLRSNSHLGLEADELKARRKAFGQNILRGEVRLSFLQSLKNQVKSLMGVFLFFAAIVMYIFDPQPVYPLCSAAVLVIMLFNAVLEWRAAKALGVPRRYSSIKAPVTRSGKTVYTDSRTLVPGDIIHLEESMVVPADCRLLSDSNLAVLETHLSGESEPQPKDSALLSDRNETLFHPNMVYAGSIVTSGSGSAIVCFTGEETLVRKLSTLRKELVMPALLRYCLAAARGFSLASIIAGFTLLALGTATGGDITNLFIVSLAIGAASLSDSAASLAAASFGLGLARMAKDGAVVKNFNCIGKLCSVNTVMCGAETVFPPARMSVDELFVDNTFIPSGGDYRGRALDLLRNALLCSNLTVDETAKRKSGRAAFSGTRWDEAMAFALDGQEIDLRSFADDYFRMDAEADSSGNLIRALYLHGGKSIAIEKGAPEEILARCKGYSYKGQAFRLSEHTRKKILDAVREKGKGSAYMLGIAICESKAQSLLDPAATKKLLFLGFITFNSFMAVDTASSIYRCRSAGIETVLASSDPYYSAVSRAEDSGIIQGESEVCTAEIMRGDDIGLFIANCPDYRLFLGLTDEEWYQILLYRKQDKRRIAFVAEKTQELQSMREADVTFVEDDSPDLLRQSADIILLSGGFRVISDCLHNARLVYVRIHAMLEYIAVAFATLLLTCAADAFLPIQLLRCQEVLFGGIIFNLLFAVALAFMPQNRALIREKLPDYGAKPRLSDFTMPIVYSFGSAAVLVAVRFLTNSYSCELLSLTLLLLLYACNNISRGGIFRKRFVGNVRLYLFAALSLGIVGLLAFFPPFAALFAYAPFGLTALLPAALLPFGFFMLFQVAALLIDSRKTKNHI